MSPRSFNDVVQSSSAHWALVEEAKKIKGVEQPASLTCYQDVFS